MKAVERYHSDMEADKISQAVGVDNSLPGLFMACSFCDVGIYPHALQETFLPFLAMG